MSVQNPRAFNEWLRAQLKAKKMSQRQLALQSGVDHSTISRLLRGDRTPSLGTATKLARGLRELRDDSDSPQYFGLTSSASTHPTARVEYALRSDDLMSEPQVRQVMEYYLALRMRRLSIRQTGRYAPVRPGGGRPLGGTSRPARQEELTRRRAPLPVSRTYPLPRARIATVRPAAHARRVGARQARIVAAATTPRSAPAAPRPTPCALDLGREQVGDEAQDDDREDADGAVHQGDGGASVGSAW